jgi:hypothetical protein
MRRIVQVLAGEWSWIAALAVGTGLRGFRLLDQVPVDDEWHSLHRLLGSSYREIALDFGFVDHCIPLTLYLKLAAETVGLNEWGLRAPSLLAGIALLVLAPLVMRPRLGAPAARIFAWLLAISPLLVFYSRFQRPYAIALLLSFLALHCCERWWSEGRARHALGLAACAATSAWFLPPTLPFVAAPFALMAAAALSGRGGLCWRRVALPLTSFAGLCALLLGPPLWSHPQALLGKLGGAQPDPASLGRAALFLAGTPSAWLATGLLGLAALGAWRARRLAPRWTAIALCASALLLLGILVSAPRYAWLGFVIARYALPALPVALALVALAIAPDATRRPLAALAPAALILLLAISGGVPRTLLETRAWFPARYVTGMEGASPRAARVPDFYRALAEAPPGSLTLVESPWFYSLWNSLLPFYEQVHRQRSLVGFSVGTCSDGHWGELPPGSGIELRSFAYLDDRAALARRGVDFVVFHADLAAELERVIDPIDVRATGQVDVRGCVRAFLASDWPLVFQDPSIVVFAAPGAPKLRWPAAGDVGY